VKTVPSLTCHTKEERETLKRIVNSRENRPALEAVFESFIFFEGFIYTFEKVADADLPTQSATHQDIEYVIQYEFHDEHGLDTKGASFFFRAFINKLIREVKFMPARGGKYFDPKNFLELQGVNMHQAFFNTIKGVNGNIYLNLNPSIKFF